jgi:cyclophilin family peptidyl-prolyl cis-trans isomerase
MKYNRIIAAAVTIAAVATLHPLHAQDASAPVVTHTAVFTTSMGTIELELYGRDAPKTVNNFVGLINQKFYDGILFHRVVPGFVIQAGDPNSRDSTKRAVWGQSGSSIYKGIEFEDELNPAAPSYQRGYVEGTLAMANRGPNTNTSQFFIMLADNDKRPQPLKKSYTMFGRVTKGMDIVHTIEQMPLLSDQSGQPVKSVVILKATATEIVSAGK